MNYEIYLEDTITGKAIQLDSTDIDFTTAFAIADIKDLLVRRDVITKDLTFKHSTINNSAFGYAFMTNKYINEADDTPILGGNYNPQLVVPCSIYENGIMVLKGNLRLKRVTLTTYECVVTGNVKEFTSIIGDLLLTDLNLSDMQHTYNFDSMSASWSATSTLDYVYPLIQYGVKFNNGNVGKTNPFNILNFKPAVYVRSIFNRIFNAADFTYQVKGDSQFLEIFNKLIIPSNRKDNITRHTYPIGGAKELVISNAGQTNKNSAYNDATQSSEQGWQGEYWMDIAINKLDSLGLFNISGQLFGGGVDNQAYGKKPQVVFNAIKTFTSTAKIEYKLGYGNNFPADAVILSSVRLLERDVIAESNAEAFRKTEGWSTIAEDNFNLPTGNGNRIGSFIIPSYTFKVGKQYRLSYAERTDSSADLSAGTTYFNMEYVNFSLPNLETQSIDVDVNIGSSIIPTLPVGVKQLDFINSIRALFNLYVYVDPDNEKNIIFEPYDSYYAATSEANLIANAINWTGYIDYKGDYSNDSNLDIPKNYNYIWKQDKDYLNDFYQNKYNKSYADLQVTDSRGITDKRDISLIFSPTITAGAYSTLNTPYFSLPVPYMYGMNGNEIEPLDTNIRLLIWNGLTITNPYTIVTETYDTANNSWNQLKQDAAIVPLASNYLFGSQGKVLFDIHSGQPNEIFFTKPVGFDTVPYSYSYYQKQVGELKSANITYLTCQMYMKASVINQLDLKTPVFIDLGKNGVGYYKVLSVIYTNAESRSTVKLQKIL